MSNINREYRNVYIHVPKTAGTTMERHDFIRGAGHASLQELSTDDNFDTSYIKWAFIRHPHERLISAFFYVSYPVLEQYYAAFGKDIKSEWVVKETRNLGLPWYKKEKDEFYNFVENLYEHRVFAQEYIHFMPMNYFLHHDEIELDFIGRFENLQEDWIKVKDLIRDNLESPMMKDKINHHGLAGKGTSPSGAKSNMKEYNDPGIVKMIEEIYKEDYEKFNY